MRSRDHARQEPVRSRGPAAAKAARSEPARSREPRTLGPNELLELQRTAGNAAVDTLIQREKGGVATVAKPPEALVDTGEVPVTEKDDDVLAEGIFDEEHEVLNQWSLALDSFDKVMTSSSDKSTRPDFKGVVVDFFEEKILGELVKRSKIPGLSDTIDLLKKIDAEAKRAQTAQESASLRDFFVNHKRAVADLMRVVIETKSNFVARVRKTPKSRHEAMRSSLVTLFEDVDSRLKEATQESLFTQLSEAWIGASTTTDISTKVPAYIVIRIAGPSCKVLNAVIHGPGSQVIAEQLLKDSPAGVDVFGMAVPRRVLWYRSDGEPYFTAVARLDRENNLTNEGSYVEGPYQALYQRLISGGLEPTKKLTGE